MLFGFRKKKKQEGKLLHYETDYQELNDHKCQDKKKYTISNFN